MSDLQRAMPPGIVRHLTESVREIAGNEDQLELSLRFRDQDISVRELTAYLDLLDGAYGRVDPHGFRSYALTQHRHLRIAQIAHGSVDLRFLFDILTPAQLSGAMTMYLIAKAGPSIIKGEAAKNWMEATKAGMEAYRLWRPITDFRRVESREQDLQALPPRDRETDQPPPLKLTRAQRKELNDLLQGDPYFSGLSERHRREVIRVVQGILGAERQRLSLAQRFAADQVIEVVLRRRRR
jgi:hypothetical protein